MVKAPSHRMTQVVATISCQKCPAPCVNAFATSAGANAKIEIVGANPKAMMAWRVGASRQPTIAASGIIEIPKHATNSRTLPVVTCQPCLR